MRCLALVMLVPAVAHAHIALTTPPARTTQQMVFPCGEAGSMRGSNITTYPAGASVQVEWTSQIQHPSHFRISLDVDGQDFMNSPDMNGSTVGVFPETLVDLIPHVSGQTSYSQMITLPNVACDSCTLQVLQVMYDRPPFTGDPGSDDFHYQCSDITIAMPPPPDGMTDGGVPQDSAGPMDGMPGDPDGGTNSAINPYVSRGCSSSTGGSGLTALAIAGLALRRSRRGRIHRPNL